MPHRLTLVEMVQHIQARKLSAVELIDAHVKHIEAENPAINAFISVLADEARLAANANPSGPLAGIPVSIKDSFDLAGHPTTCGSRLFRDLRASRDATAVARLKQAGAIPIGKTNCPEFLANYESDNFVIGRTNNPWNLDRTPGGSSGGEAAAIAAHFSAGGVGSDGGGSIRVPAHFTGIAGLKPTPGRIPGTGHTPEMTHPVGLLGVAGPMARTAADVRLLFNVIAGYDPRDPFSAPVPIREFDLESVRVGVIEQFNDVPVQDSIGKGLKKAAACLRDLKYGLDLFSPVGLERAPNLWWFIFGELPARITKELIAGREHLLHWTSTEFLNQALQQPEPSANKVIEVLSVRDKLRASVISQMSDYPVLLAPVSAVTAFKHGQRRFQAGGKEIGLFQAMMPATWVNLLGLPSVTIPFDTDPDGMPVGIQLIGRPYEEELLLELAVQMEQARGAFPSPAAHLKHAQAH